MLVRSYRWIVSWLAVWGALLIAPGFSHAQTAEEPDAAQPQTIEQRQAQVRERMERLETRMAKLAQLLAESEPDKSERLRDALERSGQKQVKRRVDQLVELLRKGQFGDADREQETLLKDLDGILSVLTDTASDADRRRAERERLEGFRREIRALQEQQTEILQRTQAAAKAAEAAAELRAQAEALEALAGEQAKLRETAGKPENAGDAKQRTEQAEAQAGLEKKAAEIQENLEKAAKALDQQQGSEAAEKAAGEVGESREKMQQAAKSIGESAEGAKSAEAQQQEAEEQLRRAIKRLREEAERLEDQQRQAGAEEGQRGLEQKAGEVEQSMEPQSGGAPQTPGQQQVKNARQNMQRAADRMGERQPGKAQPEQEQALQELQSAMDQLDDALRQVRREEMEETLAALEARLRSMLQREEGVRDEFEALAAIALPNWSRTEQLKAAATAEEQNDIAADCESVHRLARDEGTTVIFPEIVRQLGVDMRDVAQRMQKVDMSPATRGLIDDILSQLRELLAAVEAKREELQQEEESGGGGGEGGAQANPLLPGSAELKLVRSSQVRINRRTEGLSQVQGTPTAEFEELSGRQNALAEMARRMHERK